MSYVSPIMCKCQGRDREDGRMDRMIVRPTKRFAFGDVIAHGVMAFGL